MTGETKHVYTNNTTKSSSKDPDKDTAFEQFSKKDAVDTPTSGVSDNSESALIGGGDKASHLNGREKEPHSQREAVIRPQQAGKIDFKSLHNRSKFPSDTTWTNGKGSPQSPTGKSRGKDKSKRSGKGDRAQHQLYRLSITNSRTNPTIGIAYPQQKVTPPKKLEVSRGPVSGSYRFHVPSLPEREAELQQEDLSFNRCFQESSPSLTSANYTSQTAPASRTHHGLKLQPQPVNPHETTSTNGQLHYLEFQANGNSWHSSEKIFSGASGYSISSQKLCPFPEGNKSDPHCFGSMPFQYPFQSLQEPTGNSFCNTANNQNFVDISLAANQVAHSAFAFQTSSIEEQEDPQSNGSYKNILPDSRTYSLPSQQAPFLHAQQEAEHPPTPPCYTGRNEHSTDHNGAISSSGAITSSGAIDQTPSTFQENQPVFNSSEFSLHGNGVPTLVNKRQQPSKDFTTTQRLLNPGNTLRRNIPQTSLNQMHFPGEVYNSVNAGSVPFDKSISRIPQTWDAGSKVFPPLDQNSVSYTNSSGNQLSYQCQSNVDQRQALKNARMPWQQIHLTSAMPNQNRIELSRQIGNQKLNFPLCNSEWQSNNPLQKIPPSYHTKKHLSVEGISTQRSDASRQNYSSSNGILYDSTKDTNSQICDSRSKGILFGMSQPIQQLASSRNNPNQPVSLPTASLVVGSPCESPLPSPVTNPVSGSTCSSLSPMSSSPVNASSDENHIPATHTSSPYFHQPCLPTENKPFPSHHLSSSSLLYHTPESIKTFNYLSEATKDEQLFKNLQENQYPKQTSEPSKGCFENEPPPPPPYSSHHLLASSLSSANLDQLDVLLTCKQCDQNYSNLSSFLEHRQYCSLNSTLQSEMKDALRGTEVRKQAMDPIKPTHIGQGLSLPKGSMELHSHMIGFNKVVDYLLDTDAKGDTKDDPLKVNIFHSLTSNSLPLTACDILEMDDAKLDSLITEALNGLEFQADNPEIDSSFIDVFVDDDLSTAKITGCGQPYKVKEFLEAKKKPRGLEEKQARHNQTSYVYGESYEKDPSCNHRNAIHIQSKQKKAEARTLDPYFLEVDKMDIKEITPKCVELHKKGEPEKSLRSEPPPIICVNKSDFAIFEDKNTKSHEAQRRRSIGTTLSDFSSTENPKVRRPCMKNIKKKKTHNGTWSKELIHKIVQQKNKLHKLHVKSNKNLQFSLVTERLFPPTKNHPFGEYDYISDSEDEAVATSLHGKKQPLKYNFNRDHQGRGGRTKGNEPVWRMGEATQFHPKNRDLRSAKKETSNRIRRRSSQSSTSSDQSTSISSETGSSPKSTERTDSENEQEIVQRRKSLDTATQSMSAERNIIKPLYKDNPPETLIPQKDFSKGTKRFGSAKFLLASSKVYPTKSNGSPTYGDEEQLQQSKDHKYSTEDNPRNTAEGNYFKKAADEEEIVSTYHKTNIASTLLQANYPPDLTLDTDDVSQQCPSFHKNAIDYQEEQLNGSSCVADKQNSELIISYADANVKYLKDGLCNDHKDFGMPVGCYNSDSTKTLLPAKMQDSYTNESQQFGEHKELPNLYGNDLFIKPQSTTSPEIGEIYLDQSNHNSNNSSFEHKCSDMTSYPTDNNENKVSSTLTFDSSSIFAELPMSDFEAPLYSSVSPTKESYVAFACSDDHTSKATHFEQQYPQFLQGKSWDLIEEGPPVLSNSITHFQAIEDQNTDKYTERIPGSSTEMSLTLAETITDYNGSFINNMSEDELEIKRLVTELESQLQTSKLQNEIPSQPCSKHRSSTDLTHPPSPFPDMEINPIESCRNNLYFKENLDNLNMNHTVSVDQDLQESQTRVKVDASCENHKSPWTCSVQFDTFTSSIQCHKQPGTLDSFTSTEENTQYQAALNDVCLSEELDSLSHSHGSLSVMPDDCLHNLPSQSESHNYSENELVRNTLLTSETLRSKNAENKEIDQKNNHQSHHGKGFPQKEQLEDRFDDPPQLEPFQSVPELHSEFDLQDNAVPILNITSTPVQNTKINTEEAPCSPIFRSEITLSATALEYSENCSTLDGKEGSTDSTISRSLQHNDNASNRNLILLDMPILEKEESAIPEKSAIAQESADNPLQQLQLFVARTAKNNEEEMLMPCFPMLLSASAHACPQPEVEGDASYMSESKLTASKEASNNAVDNNMELEGASHLLETNDSANSEQLHPLRSKDTNPAELYKSLNNEMQHEVTLSQPIENECSGLDVINICADGMTQDHNDFLSLSNATANVLHGQVEVDEQIQNLVETDGDEVPLTIEKHRKAAYSHHVLFENEAFAMSSKTTAKVPSAIESCPSDKESTGSELPCALTFEVTRLCRGTEKQETQRQHEDAPAFVSAEDQQKDIIMLPERDLFLTNNELSKETTTTHEDKSEASVFVDGSSACFPLHASNHKALSKSNNEFSMHQQDMSKSTTHSQLSFDFFSHLPIKESVHTQVMFCSSTDEDSCPSKGDTCNSVKKCQAAAVSATDQTERHLLGGPDALLYFSEDRCVNSSSFEIDQKEDTKRKDSISSIVEENIPSCFCSDLVCTHYKEQPASSVTDIILRCQSLPSNDGYPSYAAAESQTYSTLQTELFTEGIKTVTESSLCFQEGKSLNCDCDNKEQRTHINHEYPSDDRTTTLVCNLVDIAESGLIDLSSHQAVETTDGRLVQTSKNSVVPENDKIDDSGRKCTSDMDSVINGVLRILDCDKSKEILESIGIPSRNGLIKEKRHVGLALTCDICSASFRSKPGLTRHKAVKHSMKNDGTLILPKDGAASDNILNVKYNEKCSLNSEWETDDRNLKKAPKPLSKQSFSSEIISQSQTTDLLNQESKLHCHYFNSEEERMPVPAKSKGEKRTKVHSDDTRCVEAICKQTLNGKVKKRKLKTLSSKCIDDSRVPSDDILDILKTNILKAIGQSNSFTSPDEKIARVHPSNIDKQQQETNQESSAGEIHSATKMSPEEAKAVSNILDDETNGEGLLVQQKWAKGFEDHVENIVTNICETEQDHGVTLKEGKTLHNITDNKQTRNQVMPLKSMSPNYETSLIGQDSESAPDMCLLENSSLAESKYDQKEPQVSNVSTEVEPDLQSLFDDENTFSQLFPRDDHFIRKKCTRVYGKRIKRQTPPFEADFKHMDLVEPSHSSQIRNYSCGYETISIDSTLMGSRGVSGNTETSALHAEYDQINPMKEGIDGDDERVLSFVSQHQPVENIYASSPTGESQEKKSGDVSFQDTLYKSPRESEEPFVEMSSATGESELEESYDCKINENIGLPEFPTIDMKMLSAKFDMRELSFFSACGDDSDQSDVDTPEIAQKAGRHTKHAKNRSEDRRQARNRSNVNIKSKDKQYKCKVCFQWFLTLGELDFHKLTHNPSPPPTCYMCVQRKFSSREQLRDHLKEKHAKNKAGLWICGMCLKEISDVWMYNEHLREHATQFARKGQAQKTVMGIPGCFSEESIVRTFLSTFIYRTPSKPSKTPESEDKSPACKKQDQKEHKEEEQKTEKETESSTHNTPITPSHVKLSASPPLENTQKSETIPKNTPIHPHCKDPSRDCHHCGKQFPKPFKLQRHLVVHSLQKIYLCHRCPKSYQEVQELRNHLNSEHDIAEEPEIKHTTLYACELCADVMHVIKKSFICSTCNYTFSKKEQYDRHMEKHRIGGSKTFKFRGVMRPGTSGKDVKQKIKELSTHENMPPSKKQKILHGKDSGASPNITCMNVKQSGDQPHPVPSLGILLDKEGKEKTENEQEIALKMEDMTADFPELQGEKRKDQISRSAHASYPSSPIAYEVKSNMGKNRDVAMDEKMNRQDVEIISSSTDTAKGGNFVIDDAAETTEETEPPAVKPKNPKYINKRNKPSLCNKEEKTVEVTAMGSPQVSADDVLCQMLLPKESAESTQSNKKIPVAKDSTGDLCHPKNAVMGMDKESALKSLPSDGVDISSMFSKEKSVAPDITASLKDLRGFKKNRSVHQSSSRSASQAHVVAFGSEEAVKSCAPKVKTDTETCSLARDSNTSALKETMGSHHKVSKKELTPHLVKHNNADFTKSTEKIAATLPLKLHTKKRKEYKVSGHKGGSVSQENLEGEGKKKKTKLLGTGKSESSGSLKKPEWTSHLSTFTDTKDEALCSRHYSKSHTGGASGQFKKLVLDLHNQKKADSRSSNGEYKRKKELLTKTLHTFTPKSPALPLHSPSHKRRLGHNTKPTEPSNYRTAESQNNLLSQLFGQKLTSFKIPLRRDISE
ncbi:zinc finger protein 469 [Ascaphus truei]|uniref:zinc finger protein 469 n=1 Tax=Ascaphus truei TaxID=8439 RepID=UPI003F5AD797